MRLGISSSLNQANAKEWAKSMVELGCKSVVFPLNSSASDELISEYTDEAKKSDLLIAEVGVWRNAIANSQEEALRNMEYSINQMRLADRIGARCCVNVAGSCGPRWDGGYKENFSKEMWKKTVKMIQTVIDEAKPVNSFFTMEPMPWMVPTGPEEYLNLIEDVARDQFAVHMDIINMVNCPDRYFFQEEFLDKTFNLLGDKIKSCHIKDVQLLDGFTFQLKECACGEGSFNLERYASLANEYDKNMPMIIEHLSSDDEYRSSIAYVRDRMAKANIEC